MRSGAQVHPWDVSTVEVRCQVFCEGLAVGYSYSLFGVDREYSLLLLNVPGWWVKSGTVLGRAFWVTLSIEEVDAGVAEGHWLSPPAS